MSTTPLTDAIAANNQTPTATLMPLAFAQFSANPPSTWNSGGAVPCLDAVYWLLANRGQSLGDMGSTISYETLESTKKTLETRLGTSAPRAMGRRRLVGVGYGRDGIG